MTLPLIISPMMQPTDQISTEKTHCGEHGSLLRVTGSCSSYIMTKLEWSRMTHRWNGPFDGVAAGNDWSWKTHMVWSNNNEHVMMSLETAGATCVLWTSVITLWPECKGKDSHLQHATFTNHFLCNPCPEWPRELCSSEWRHMASSWSWCRPSWPSQSPRSSRCSLTWPLCWMALNPAMTKTRHQHHKLKNELLRGHNDKQPSTNQYVRKRPVATQSVRNAHPVILALVYAY